MIDFEWSLFSGDSWIEGKALWPVLPRVGDRCVVDVDDYGTDWVVAVEGVVHNPRKGTMEVTLRFHGSVKGWDNDDYAASLDHAITTMRGWENWTLIAKCYARNPRVLIDPDPEVKD